MKSALDTAMRRPASLVWKTGLHDNGKKLKPWSSATSWDELAKIGS